MNNIYFLLLLLVTPTFLFSMAGDQEGDSKELYIFELTGTSKEREEAWQWFEKQNVYETINALGPKLEKLLTISFESIPEETNPLMCVYDSTSSLGITHTYTAFRIKQLVDKSEKELQFLINATHNPHTSYNVHQIAAFCIKWYRINQALGNYIEQQKIDGPSIKTTYKKNNLNPSYIGDLFAKIRLLTYIGFTSK